MAGIVVHEWMEHVGGAELVVNELLKAFPGADLLTLWNDVDVSAGGDVLTSWMAGSPLRKRKALALPLMAAAWRGLIPDRPYDFALVSSHAFAHHVSGRGASASVPKLVYCHTPARYIWAPEHEARGQSLPIRAAARALMPLDRRRAGEAASIVGNSRFIADRIQRAWGREAGVVYPPVAVDAIQSVPDWSTVLDADDAAVLASLPRDFVMGASRLVAYKRLDTVIRTGELLDIPVVIAGGGPDGERLRAIAEASSVPVHLLGRVSRPLMLAAMQRARLFVFPPVEDFGITPVEVMALGTQVLVNEVGGARESVEVVGGGRAVNVDDEAQLAVVAQSLLESPLEFSPGAAEAFSEKAFAENIHRWVEASV